jgi:hypothetical protein
MKKADFFAQKVVGVLQRLGSLISSGFTRTSRRTNSWKGMFCTCGDPTGGSTGVRTWALFVGFVFFISIYTFILVLSCKAIPIRIHPFIGKSSIVEFITPIVIIPNYSRHIGSGSRVFFPIITPMFSISQEYHSFDGTWSQGHPSPNRVIRKIFGISDSITTSKSDADVNLIGRRFAIINDWYMSQDIPVLSSVHGWDSGEDIGSVFFNIILFGKFNVTSSELIRSVGVFKCFSCLATLIPTYQSESYKSRHCSINTEKSVKVSSLCFISPEFIHGLFCALAIFFMFVGSAFLAIFTVWFDRFHSKRKRRIAITCLIVAIISFCFMGLFILEAIRSIVCKII